MTYAHRPIVYGARYSVYVQALLLCLEEKQVPYDLVEVDVFADGGAPSEHLSRHPFGRIPAFEHGALRLYETAPICRYVDEAFDGPALQPATAAARARMGQAISIADNYAYRSLVWGLYVETVEKPARGDRPDESLVAAAHEQAATCLGALQQLAPEAPWLVGDAPTLADLHLAPMFTLFLQAPAAVDLMKDAPRLRRWFDGMRERPSVRRACPSPRTA
ncbi:glutathione S-transferase family protein [Caulobacter mirabilis]|uniref:glutathione transferase n=1 Tax=Caulobacter mirabilis TaxID=69666 RepID=A0A2D2B195_9CAUL|nr:glutathione S-transferase family protein [Caulobacter mirabilis]ATQ44030.1 glutathione S-transferase [Caulobacter mirabilis]